MNIFTLTLGYLAATLGPLIIILAVIYVIHAAVNDTYKTPKDK